MVKPRPVPPYLRVVEVLLLLEGPEDALLLIERDADAGIPRWRNAESMNDE